MRFCPPRTFLATAAALTLTASVLAPTAVMAKGPGSGNGAAGCDGDCTADQAQVQQVQQAQQVPLQQGEEAKPYVSIEPASKTANLLSGVSRANLSAVKKVDGVLIVTSQGINKAQIVKNVESTIKLIKERHEKIFSALSSSGVQSVLPTEMIGKVTVTDQPVKPKKALILALTGVLGLMLGVFIALIRRAVKNRRQKELAKV